MAMLKHHWICYYRKLLNLIHLIRTLSQQDLLQTKNIERFRCFFIRYITLDKQNLNRVIDISYSFLPQQIKPLWKLNYNRQLI